MKNTVRRIGVLASTAALAVTAFAATPASADPTWVDDPSSCSSVTTMAEKSIGVGAVIQIRRGYCYGTAYYWARATGSHTPNFHIYDKDGNLKGSDSTDNSNSSGSITWTKGRQRPGGWKVRAIVFTSTPVYVWYPS